MKTNFRWGILFIVSLCATILGPTPVSVQAVISQYVVDSTGDEGDANKGDGKCKTAAGVCTLRAAIDESNATPAIHEDIIFAIPGSGPHRITPATRLFSLNSASIIGPNQGNGATIILDGSGSVDTGLLFVNNNGGAISGLRIENFISTGIHIYSGNTNTTIANNAILSNGNLAGIRIGGSGGSDNVGFISITGNYIGIDPLDDTPKRNNLGIEIYMGQPENTQVTIGGNLSEQRNIISGNSTGIEISGGSTSNSVTVQGNYIGTNAAGTSAVPNSDHGMVLSSAATVVKIGGAASSEANVISGNGVSGIEINNCAGTLVQGNLMSTNASGTAFLPNPTHPSERDVVVQNSQLISVTGNTLLQGLFFTTDENGLGVSESTIEHNKVGITASKFVRPLGVNRFGLRFNKTTSTSASYNEITGFNTGIRVEEGSGVTLLHNSIWNNSDLGIDLLKDGLPGVTLNDPFDADSGPNGLQNFPVITSVTKRVEGGVAVYVDVAGTLHSTPNKNFRIELFSGAACDANGYGEGQKFVTWRNVTTDASGNASWTVTDLLYKPLFDLMGPCLSATATYALTFSGPFGGTSEFSAGVEIDPKKIYIPLIRY
jgi:CSLREA domain-containing protein